MTNYTVRRATFADADALVRHRIRMFADMGVMSTPDPNDAAVAETLRLWLADLMPTGRDVAWVVEGPDQSPGKATSPQRQPVRAAALRIDRLPSDAQSDDVFVVALRRKV